jgi:Domain of unknown function (DUF4177)
MKNFFMILSLTIIFGLGWFANEALQTQRIYAAAKPVEYKIVRDGREGTAAVEKTLNTYAQQGWRLHSLTGEGLIFER